MRRAVISAALALALSGATAGCSSVHVTTDYDRSVDFAALRTFSWMPRGEGEPDPFAGNTIVEKRVTSAIERELAAKGLRPAQGAGDFEIALHTSTRDRLEVNTWPGWGYGWGRRGVWGAWNADRVEVSQWTEGTLVVDLVDPAKKELLWRGVARSAIDSASGSPEKVDAAVKALFAEFPPAPGR